MQAIAKGVIVCLIAMIDPSGGLGTVAVELPLPYISELLELAYSREMEMQATLALTLTRTRTLTLHK